MFFGKFLVENNLITIEQLSRALCRQINSIPSILEVLLEEGHISDNQLIEVVNLHLSQKTDISKIILDNEYLNQDRLEELYIIQNQKKISLSEILVEEGIISSIQVSEYISTYSEKYDLPELLEDEKGLKSDAASEAVETGVAINAAALESLKELGFTDEQAMAELEGQVMSSPTGKESLEVIETKDENIDDSLQEYLDLFNQKKYNRLKKSLKIINDCIEKNQDASTYLSSVYKEFYVLKGAASFASLTQSQNILISWEGILEKLFKYDKNNLSAWLRDNLDSLFKSVSLLWNIRNEVKAGNTGHFDGEHHEVADIAEKLALAA